MSYSVVTLVGIVLFSLCEGFESSWSRTEPDCHHRQLADVIHVSSTERRELIAVLLYDLLVLFAFSVTTHLENLINLKKSGNLTVVREVMEKRKTRGKCVFACCQLL